MVRNLLVSTAVSLVATLAMVLTFVFILGSYTYIPTAAAAHLKAVPAHQEAAWIVAHTRVVRGAEYARFVATDPGMRAAIIDGAAYVFGFGLACAFASAFIQRRGRVT